MTRVFSRGLRGLQTHLKHARIDPLPGPAHTAAMRLRLLMISLLALLCVAAGKKQPQLTVRFFAEANRRDTNEFAIPVTLQYPPRQAYISKIPVVSERDIAAIYPFDAGDGTMGCAFKLDVHGTLALDTVSVEKRGTSLVAMVNSRQILDMQIDRRVSDGILTIPRGLTPQEIAQLQKKYKTLGQGKKS